MKQEQIKGKSCIHVTRYNVPYSILIYVISYSVRQLSHIFLFLGNSYLSQLTGCDSYKLRVILTDTEGQSKNADYSYFKVDGPDFKYSLHISGYSGPAGNYLYCIMWYVSWTNIYVAWKWYLSHLPINHDRDNICYFISGKCRTWRNGKKFTTKVIIHFYFIIGNIMVLHNGEKFTTKNKLYSVFILL